MKFDPDYYNLFVKGPLHHTITEKAFNKLLNKLGAFNKTLIRRISIIILIREKFKHENDINKTCILEELTITIESGNNNAVYWALKHPLINSNHIDRALDYIEDDIRIEAIQHVDTSTDNINKALLDNNPYVRKLAIYHYNFNEKNINFVFCNGKSFLRKEVIDLILIGHDDDR